MIEFFLFFNFYFLIFKANTHTLQVHAHNILHHISHNWLELKIKGALRQAEKIKGAHTYLQQSETQNISVQYAFSTTANKKIYKTFKSSECKRVDELIFETFFIFQCKVKKISTK